MQMQGIKSKLERLEKKIGIGQKMRPIGIAFSSACFENPNNRGDAFKYTTKIDIGNGLKGDLSRTKSVRFYASTEDELVRQVEQYLMDNFSPEEYKGFRLCIGLKRIKTRED